MSIARSLMRVFVLSLLALCCAVQCRSGAVLKPNGAGAMPVYTRSVSVRGEVEGQFAQTTLVMVFQNESQDQIEADFIYALPPGAVATYFAYWAGDEKVEAKIVEKKEAARIYQHLTTYTRDPALVEFTGKNTFRARISPVFANQDLKVEIRYVQVLPSDGDSVTYSVPIGPSASAQPDPLESIDVQVRVKGDNRMRSVANNYGVPMTKDSGDHLVTIRGANYRPHKDLSVRITRSHCPLRAELTAEPGSGHFSLALTPDHSLKRPRVSISGVHATQLAPARLPNVRAGRAIVVSGHHRGGKARVTLSGQGSSGRKVYSVVVDFDDAPWSGTSAPLWAAARISDLGSKRSNRKAVVRLSFAYRLPSRYTSWLAVPKAETEQLEQESKEPKLQSLASKMVGMIADGKKDSPVYRVVEAEYNALRKTVDGDGRDWRLISELEQEEYQAVRKVAALRYADKPDAALQAAWKARAERVWAEMSRISPDHQVQSLDQQLTEGERSWLYSQCQDLAHKLVQLTMDGKSSTDHVKNTRARYLRLREHLPSDASTMRDPYPRDARYRAEDLARNLVDERHKPRPNKTVMAELRAKIDRLSSSADFTSNSVLVDAESDWARTKCWSEADAYAWALTEGDTRKAEYHRARHDAMARAAGIKDPDSQIKSTLEGHYYQLAYEYCIARRDRSMRPAELRRLHDRANRLAKLTGKSLEERVADEDARDASERLYATAQTLMSELERQRPLRSRVERLRKDTGRIASELGQLKSDRDYARNADAFNTAADQVITAWLEEQKVKAMAETGGAGQEDLARAAKTRKEAGEKLEASLYYIRWSVRGGDPLISVEAPEDALKVIALLPDGDVKTLAWNPANRRWEARFDVPTGTADGDYIVQIIVILSDGTRKLTSVNYKVDNTPPSGLAGAAACGSGSESIRLEVRPDEDLARVVALLPWGERVELRRSGDERVYTAVVRVPAGASPGKVEFVLTDNAHNRASVCVDPEAP